MGLLDTIRSALGLQRPLVPRDPDTPMQVSEEARAWLESRSDGEGLHLALKPTDGGWVVQVQEGQSQGPPPPPIEPLPISVSDEDLHKLRGLMLDRKNDRWAVSVELDLRGRETPNPNGRQYLCNRWLAVGRPMFFTPGGDTPPLAAQLLAIGGVQSVLLRDNTLSVERAPDVPWDGIDAHVDATLRQYFLRCGHELTAADLPKREDPFEEDILAVLEERVLPGIHRDGGDLELLGIEDGVVRVALHGACRKVVRHEPDDLVCISDSGLVRIGEEDGRAVGVERRSVGAVAVGVIERRTLLSGPLHPVRLILVADLLLL